VTPTLITFPTGASIQASGCTIIVTVTSSTPGAVLNTTSSLQTGFGVAPPATAPLTVTTVLPALAKTIAPATIVSGGSAVLTITIGNINATPLPLTAPFTDAMVAAVRSWTFTPALDAPVPAAGAQPDPTEQRPMASTVLVLGVFRPPSLFPVTLGEPAKAVATPSGAAPALASALEMPAYPVNALSDGVVLLELDVAAHGGVEGIGVVRSSSPFDKAAIGAASALGFAPGKVHGRPAAARVYVVAAFRQPIT